MYYVGKKLKILKQLGNICQQHITYNQSEGKFIQISIIMILCDPTKRERKNVYREKGKLLNYWVVNYDFSSKKFTQTIIKHNFIIFDYIVSPSCID